MIEYVTASHDQTILANNLLRSPGLLKHGIHIQSGFTNVSAAYNAVGIQFKYQLPEQFKKPVVVYVHHDVFLPESFESDLYKALERVPDDWGVLGVAGVKLVNGFKQIHGYISDRGKKWGSPWNLPAEVDTLDELLLITRGDLVFDENLDQDFYGADICMQARAAGKKCYAINAYCEHNSGRPMGGRTEAFYRCQTYFRNKWIDYLPIGTTCALIN